MARLVLNGALKRAAGNAGGAVAAISGPRYAFISNPACCPKCSEMDSRRTGRLYTIADTWRISHINCLCSTVEVPAGVGMDPQSVISFAMNPVGGILRRGFNFGQSLAPTKLTEANWQNVLGKAAKMAEPTVEGRRRVLARAKITAQRKGAYRKAYNKAGDSWNDVEAQMPMVKLSSGRTVSPKKGQSFEELLREAGTGRASVKPTSVVKVRKARNESPVFTPTGRVAKSATVKAQKLKKNAAKVAARRSVSKGTKDLAKLFGAIIK